MGHDADFYTVNIGDGAHKLDASQMLFQKHGQRLTEAAFMLYEAIKKLVQYGIETGLTPECERIYTTNLLLELFKEDDYREEAACDYHILC